MFVFKLTRQKIDQSSSHECWFRGLNRRCASSARGWIWPKGKRDERKKNYADCCAAKVKGSKSTAASLAVQKKKEFSLCRARTYFRFLWLFASGAHETHIKTEPEGWPAGRRHFAHRGTFLTHSIPKSKLRVFSAAPAVKIHMCTRLSLAFTMSALFLTRREKNQRENKTASDMWMKTTQMGKYPPCYLNFKRHYLSVSKWPWFEFEMPLKMFSWQLAFLLELSSEVKKWALQLAIPELDAVHPNWVISLSNGASAQ